MTTVERVGIYYLITVFLGELRLVSAAVDDLSDLTVNFDLQSNHSRLSLRVLRKRDFKEDHPASNGPFGVLTWKQGRDVKVCEGALIGPRHVLTVADCEPDYWNSAEEPITDLMFEWRGTRWSVDDVYAVPRVPYRVMLLSNNLGSLDPPYAILSWFGDDQADESFNIKQELVADYPFTLSNALKDSPAPLTGCRFTEGKDDEMVLSCPIASRPRNGSAFFKYLVDSDEYVVVGLVYWAANSSNTTALRAKKLTEDSIQQIMSVAKSINSSTSLPEDTNYMPSETVIGTFNMQGFANQKRDLGGGVLSTLIELFRVAHITAVQETSRLDYYPDFVSSLEADGLSFVPSSGNSYRTGFVINSSAVTVEDSDCRSSGTLLPVKIYACNFKLSLFNSSMISVYNVHLKAGTSLTDVKKRAEQIEALRRFIESDSNRMPVYIIAGDMNARNAEELKKNQISQLPDMRHHEPGITTPGGGHYDRILVSDNLRLTHHFTPVPRDANREEIEETFHQFFPSLTPGRIKPTHRNFELSDHLPLYYYDASVDVKFGTWNMQKKLETRPELDKYYEKIFKLYDVIALQGIQSRSLFCTSVRDTYLGRKWTISSTLIRERLAFAYDEAKFNEPQCEELSVPARTVRGKDKEERKAYLCKFQVKLTDKTLILANVDILSPGQLHIGRKYKDTLHTKFSTSLGSTTKGYMVGDYNMDAPARSRNVICKHRVAGHDWTFTMADSKHVRDYIWDISEDYPGVSGCEVLNPELLDIAGTPVFENQPGHGGRQMKSFARWKEISDHFPVFMEFQGWKQTTPSPKPVLDSS